jgi:NitT/TauT family transport system ATP-binding protein
MNVISVKNLQFAYNDNLQTEVLSDLSFNVAQKEFVSIIGPSGSGKTTLLRLVAGLLQGYVGEIFLDQKTPPQARMARTYGFVSQQSSLLPWRTVRRNLLLPLELANSTDKEKRVDELLNLIGLSGFQDHLPSQISGGMQRLTAIGRALALDPDVLLLDEPFASLDEVTRERMNNELEKIVLKTRKTVLLVTHSIEEAVYLSDRVIVLSHRPAKISAVVKIDRPKVTSSSSLSNVEGVRGMQFRSQEYFFQKVVSLRQELEKGMTTWYFARVVSGEGRGRKLGFPTLNLDISSLPLEHGVYAAEVKIAGKSYGALMHYGPKSTFGGQKDSVEVHVLDFGGEKSVPQLELRIVEFIRPTIKFHNQAQLVEQMNRDKEAAKTILQQTSENLLQ